MMTSEPTETLEKALSSLPVLGRGADIVKWVKSSAEQSAPKSVTSGSDQASQSSLHCQGTEASILPYFVDSNVSLSACASIPKLQGCNTFPMTLDDINQTVEAVGSNVIQAYRTPDPLINTGSDPEILRTD